MSMRPKIALLSLTVLGLLAGAPEGAAETTRTLRLALNPDSVGRFAVENLAGVMRVTAGSGTEVVAIATVHAESEDLAAGMRFEQVTNEQGIPALRLRYPADRHSTFRYPGSGSGRSFFGWGDSSSVKYDGRKVRVSSSGGVLLYADVEVHVPRKRVEATFRNAVGALWGDGLEGTVRFDTGSGDIELSKMRGDVVADTGSGDVKAVSVSGTLKCDTGSGDCDIQGFDGDVLECDTGSGTITVRSVTARRIAADSGSGDVNVSGADVEEFFADTGSGDVDLEAPGKRLVRVKADTGSGDVRLRLARDATFEARADIGSGDVVSRFSDAQAIVVDKEVVGYRRGDARIRISVDTGSGDLVLEPVR